MLNHHNNEGLLTDRGCLLLLPLGVLGVLTGVFLVGVDFFAGVVTFVVGVLGGNLLRSLHTNNGKGGGREVKHCSISIYEHQQGVSKSQSLLTDSAPPPLPYPQLTGPKVDIPNHW